MLLEMDGEREEGGGEGGFSERRREWGWDRWRRWVRRRELTSGVGVLRFI